MLLYLWTPASTAFLPFGSMGQLELLAEDLGELVERHVDLEDVLAGCVAGLPAPSPSWTSEPALPLALADAPPSPEPKVNRGSSICGRGMLTTSFPLRPIISPCVTYFSGSP
jgi:hypothetical protein